MTGCVRHYLVSHDTQEEEEEGGKTPNDSGPYTFKLPRNKLALLYLNVAGVI